MSDGPGSDRVRTVRSDSLSDPGPTDLVRTRVRPLMRFVYFLVTFFVKIFSMFRPALFLPNFHKNRIDKACVDFAASGSLSKIIIFWFPFCFFNAINTFDYESAPNLLKFCSV